jgi:lysosomal acid lipase/cholesteryl ester hydrolase
VVISRENVKKKMRLVVLTVFLVCCRCNAKVLSKSDSVLELISNAGYQGETHEVETEDGHYLRVHRVLPKFPQNGKRQNPVFLMHGILATAADFLVTGPEIALAFLLADNDYDVWLGNARGNKFSTEHRNYSSSSKEFWTFSWHEIGFYDLPAMIDYMLNETKALKAFYVGHSQGTTAFLVMLSTRPEYNNKIIEAHLMAPSAFRKKLPRLRTVLYSFEFLVRF